MKGEYPLRNIKIANRKHEVINPATEENLSLVSRQLGFIPFFVPIPYAHNMYLFTSPFIDTYSKMPAELHPTYFLKQSGTMEPGNGYTATTCVQCISGGKAVLKKNKSYEFTFSGRTLVLIGTLKGLGLSESENYFDIHITNSSGDITDSVKYTEPNGFHTDFNAILYKITDLDDEEHTVTITTPDNIYPVELQGIFVEKYKNIAINLDSVAQLFVSSSSVLSAASIKGLYKSNIRSFNGLQFLNIASGGFVSFGMGEVNTYEVTIRISSYPYDRRLLFKPPSIGGYRPKPVYIDGKDYTINNDNTIEFTGSLILRYYIPGTFTVYIYVVDSNPSDINVSYVIK